MIQPVPASPGSSGAKDSTPVIANVVSLASAPAAQPTATSTNVLQGKMQKITREHYTVQTSCLNKASFTPALSNLHFLFYFFALRVHF